MAVWDGQLLVVGHDQEVPDVSGSVEVLNRAWSAARSEDRLAVWVERRSRAGWVATADSLPSAAAWMEDGPYEALSGLCEALVRSGRAKEASYGRERVTASGVGSLADARAVAAVFADLFAGRTASAEQLLQLLAAPSDR
ncbi:hypothetical protein [Kitasatospora purpeofusca]|uniref:hypothetical protein n=1 Tax=Kitasatospora purpeofusca TaxID=67352 RepID=UPI00382D3540